LSTSPLAASATASGSASATASPAITQGIIANHRPAKIRRLRYRPSDLEQLTIDPLRKGEERTKFERDRSRIVHSAAFRRLQGKTQVITTGQGDFFRTRLTHSLEVAQIAKGLALALGADTDLVESLALAHDIGHPPFGHVGESELARLMKNFGGFEANAQNLRVLAQLEQKSGSYNGLNLTRATIDGLLKYRTNRGAPDSNGKYDHYDDDVTLFQWATADAFPNPTARPFECDLLDWADDIAYAVHDLEDACKRRWSSRPRAGIEVGHSG